MCYADELFKRKNLQTCNRSPRGDRNEDIAALDAKDKIVVQELSDWHSEIRRAFDSFCCSNPGDIVESAFISGGGTNVNGFYRLLAEKESMKVSIFNPFSNITVSSRLSDDFFLEQTAAQAPICMGLAARRV